MTTMKRRCVSRGSRAAQNSRRPTFGENPNAVRKAGVHVRIEFCDDGIVATTLDESQAKSNLNVDDELENWRRKKNENKS